MYTYMYMYIEGECFKSSLSVHVQPMLQMSENTERGGVEGSSIFGLFQ